MTITKIVEIIDKGEDGGGDDTIRHGHDQGQGGGGCCQQGLTLRCWRPLLSQLFHTWVLNDNRQMPPAPPHKKIHFTDLNQGLLLMVCASCMLDT